MYETHIRRLRGSLHLSTRLVAFSWGVAWKDDDRSVDEDDDQTRPPHVRTLGVSDASNLFFVVDRVVRQLTDQFGTVERAPEILISMHDLLLELTANMKEAAR